MTAFFYNFSDIVILLSGDIEDRPSFFKHVNNGLHMLAAYIKSHLYPDIKISAGTIENDISKLGESFRHASDSLPYAGFLNNDTIVYYQDFCSADSSGLQYPEKHMERLLISIKLMDLEAALDAVKELAKYIRKLESVNRVYVKMLTSECALAAMRAFKEVMKQVERDEINLHSFFELLIRCESVDEWEIYLNNMTAECIKHLERMYKDRRDEVVAKVLQIAESLLNDPELSIELVSEHIYISPNYLRQLFKQKTGKSFVEYITSLRLEKAAYLITNTSIKIQDIAESVAYNDSRYFASCFKKHFGLSPTEYRDKNRIS